MLAQLLAVDVAILPAAGVRDRAVALSAALPATAPRGLRLGTSQLAHVTLGHAASAPRIDPFVFDAATIAVCHLGRFCTCRRVVREWTLSGPGERKPSPDTGRPSE